MMRAYHLSLILFVATLNLAFIGIRNPFAADEPETAPADPAKSGKSETLNPEKAETATKPAVEQQNLLQRIADEWAKRRGRYQSLDVTVLMKSETSPQDDQVKMLRELLVKPKKKKTRAVGDDGTEKQVPHEEEVIREEEQWRLLIDGRRSRMERTIVAPEPKIWITVDDGTELSELISFRQLKNGLPVPYAFVSPSENRKLSFSTWPIFFSFPGLKKLGPSIGPSGLKLRDQGGVFEGKDCIIVESLAGGNGEKHLLWLAPDMDFSIVRFAITHGEQPRFQLDCRYQKDPSDFWIPESWTYQRFDGAGKSTSTSELKVLSYNLAPNVLDSDIDLNFPVGTVVTDSRYDRKIGYTYLVTPEGDQSHPTLTKVIEANSGKWAKGAVRSTDQISPSVAAGKIPSEIQASSKIELLGGKITRNTTDSNRPIIAVRFGRDSRFRDKYLWLLKKELPDLTELSFSDPQITDACFQSLKDFKKLNALTLWVPDLTAHRLTLLSDLQALTSVSIVGGRIANEGLVALNGLKQLQKLHIERTTLTDARLEGLRELKELRELRLIKCGLMPHNLTGLTELTSLTTLDLSDSDVMDEGLQHLRSMKHLKELLIPNTGITDNSLKELNNLPELTWLDIRRCSTTDAGLKELKSLTHLTHLNLASTKITDDGVKDIAEHRQLTLLDLSGCPVTDASMSHLKQLSNLTWLSLRNTQITADGLKELQTLQSVTHLELAGTSISRPRKSPVVPEFSCSQRKKRC